MKTGHKEILGRDMRMDAWEWTQSIQIFFYHVNTHQRASITHKNITEQ